ncbi:hypothetical protein NITHO_380005 [Nitrolancea hollandica Lb]|uniref:Uncharacterized protein n=1 Tax=Nitrolancea hollandica Lb TaxID=1129897 RepID=I4EJ37_9BACT|nr:hypothetical protein NITHO_380005 [Nitrolancea hollandica Lb]
MPQPAVTGTAGASRRMVRNRRPAPLARAGACLPVIRHGWPSPRLSDPAAVRERRRERQTSCVRPTVAIGSSTRFSGSAADYGKASVVRALNPPHRITGG